MYSKMHPRVLLICYCFIFPSILWAQPKVTAFTDVGTKNVTHGLFIKSSAIGQYKFGRNLVESGLLMNLKSNNRPPVPGVRILASREVIGRRKPLELQGFLLQNTLSDILSETNYGAVLKLKRKYYELSIGTNFRTYAFRQSAIETFKIENNAAKYTEPWNLMYSLALYLKQHNSSWNIGLTVTNFDYFLINQETNPQLNLNGLYKLNTQISLFAQAWYETSGLFNMYANYYGLFGRTGIILLIQ